MNVYGGAAWHGASNILVMGHSDDIAHQNFFKKDRRGHGNVGQMRATRVRVVHRIQVALACFIGRISTGKSASQLSKHT